MTSQEIVKQLKAWGTEGYKKTLQKHGIPEPFYGVKVEDMKKIVKATKKDYALSKELYATGIYDAMYLAGLMADDEKMTKKDLEDWLKGANCGLLIEYMVPWVAAESLHGRDMGMKWIESKDPKTATAGWATLGSLVTVKPDAELDIPELRALLKRVVKTITAQPDRVKVTMNQFVIWVGGYVVELADEAMKTAKEMGKVKVDAPGSCTIAHAPDAILKMKERGTLGRKRKSAKC